MRKVSFSSARWRNLSPSGPAHPLLPAIPDSGAFNSTWISRERRRLRPQWGGGGARRVYSLKTRMRSFITRRCSFVGDNPSQTKDSDGSLSGNLDVRAGKMRNWDTPREVETGSNLKSTSESWSITRTFRFAGSEYRIRRMKYASTG